jgi:hypothetical protein
LSLDRLPNLQVSSIAAKIRAVFRESRDFEPVEADAWFSPNVDLTPSTAAQVLEAAPAQLGSIQRDIPGATSKALTIAKVGPDEGA